MSNDNGNMPAMPTKDGMIFYLPEDLKGHIDKVVSEINKNYTGLTKREQFAAMAMQGSLAGDADDALTVEDIAIQSRQLADALLKELEDSK